MKAFAKFPYLWIVLFLLLSLELIPARRSFRSYRSYRSRYTRYSSVRYTRYTRYTRYSSVRYTRYYVPAAVLSRKGGYIGGLRKNNLMLAGSVYLAYKLRPRYHYPGGYGYRWDNDWDDYAFCSGTVKGVNSKNESSDFKYFLCPSDLWDMIGPDKKYCCGPQGAQRCCNKMEFYREYGTAASATGVIVAVVVLFVIMFGGGIAACYCYKRSQRSRQRPTTTIVTASNLPDNAYPKSDSSVQYQSVASQDAQYPMQFDNAAPPYTQPPFNAAPPYTQPPFNAAPPYTQPPFNAAPPYTQPQFNADPPYPTQPPMDNNTPAPPPYPG